MSIYSELKSWQSLIGTLAGFLTLLIGGLWTFRLNRKRDAEIRKEEADSVLLALYGEILWLRNTLFAYADMISSLHSNDEYQSKIYDAETLSAPFAQSMVYQALVSKLGLLEPRDALAIVTFYTAYFEARDGYPEILSTGDRSAPAPISRFLRPAHTAIIQITETLRKVEKVHNLMNYSGDPNTRRITLAMEDGSRKYVNNGIERKPE